MSVRRDGATPRLFDRYMHAETPYFQALREQSGSKSLPALVELLSLRVSETCVWTLSGSQAHSNAKHDIFRFAQGAA